MKGEFKQTEIRHVNESANKNNRNNGLLAATKRQRKITIVKKDFAGVEGQKKKTTYLLGGSRKITMPAENLESAFASLKSPKSKEYTENL